MQNRHPLKTILQIYSIVPGIIGISFLYVAITLTAAVISSKEYLALLLNIFILSISGMLIYISYKTIFKFSKKAIIELATFTGLVCFLVLSRLFDKYFPFAKSPDIEFQKILINIGPIILGYLVYKLMRSITLRIATKNNII